MKQTLLFVFCCLFPVSALAADTSTLIQQVQRAAQKSHVQSNTGAIKNNKRLDLYIYETIFHRERGRIGKFRADFACKAYALGGHWLLLAGTCMRPDNADIWETDDHKLISREERQVFTYEGHEFTNMAYNSKIMLVWYNQAQYIAPFVNVLAASSPKQLFTLSKTHQVQINTARYGKDAVRTREFDTHSAHGKYFKLNERWTQLPGTATDPLFLINSDKNEFLAGYNNGYLHYNYLLTLNDFFFQFDGLPSDTWYSLSLEDLHFIRATVQAHRPQDWPLIKTRLFYNTTDLPYFE